MRLKGKKVLVVGLGRSGEAATRFFLDQGARVAVTDLKQEEELSRIVQEWKGLPIEWHLGNNDGDIFVRQDLICVSPGVSMEIPGLKRAHRKRIPILGEMGVAVLYLQSPFIAVTGTNGKSTTSTLIAELINASGQKAALAGNIGRPLLEVVMENKKYDYAVVEVSSFQMETVKKFHPKVAVLLNLTEDHLDRYATFRDYVHAKMRILKDQTYRDWVVFNQESQPMKSYLSRSKARHLPFSMHSILQDGLFVSSGRIVRRWKGEFEDYPLEKVKLIGLHNVENMMASIGVARICEVPSKTIREVLERFEGLPHRMQLVRERNGVLYYNDSKGTNIDALAKSLSGFKDHQVILIAGGKHKGGSFVPLRSLIAQKVKSLLLIGDASRLMARQLKETASIAEVGTMENAVKKASEEAKPGDRVLLSPGCASFDQYKNFEERGKHFQEIVAQLI